MDHTSVIFGAEVIGGTAIAAGLIRFGIRSYFREKAKHLVQLMQEPQDSYELQDETKKEK